MNMLWLGDPISSDLALVGGKAAEGGCLADPHQRVPDGSCPLVTVPDQAHRLDLRDELAHGLTALMACHLGLDASTTRSPHGDPRAAAIASQVLQTWRSG